MAKVTGAYQSVVKGVSEQVPQDRRSGQHTEQVNMISDPVRGLARRHGSRLLDEVSLGALDYGTLTADTVYHKVTTFSCEGKKYDLIYRTKAAIGGNSSFAWCFDKAAQQFLPVVYSTGDATLTALLQGGVSAATNVGRYIYLAGNTIVPTFTATDVFGAVANQKHAAVWVRGGAYSRTFTVKVTKVDGTKLEASYKTVSSSYPETLDTSDILTGDADYQKKVNDRVYAYNSAVTQWIGTSSENITPENIANELKNALIAVGITGVSVVGSTVVITDVSIKEITSDDGGDGSLLHAVGNELTAAELVSTVHFVGKIVKVRPQHSNGDDAFYLQAYAKNDGDTGFAEVSWREAAGYVMQPTTAFCMGTVVAGTMYIGGTPAKLEDISGIEVPDFKPNTVGDGITSILPYLFGKTITFLGMFKDRLMIGAGSTLLASRPGDYLNWFRQSVLTVNDVDPWEGYAQGAEDDTMRYSTTYDRDLIIFGDKFQYSISGRAIFTPKTADILIATDYPNATDAQPRATGNLIFYGKYDGEPGEEKATLHQVQAGAIAESPESYEVSQPLDGYIKGRPVEIAALTTPHMILLRTDAARDTLYTYSFLDSADGTNRLTDSWSRWTWHTKLGSIVGLSDDGGDVLAYLVRENAGTCYIACERFVRQTARSKRAYLDSLRPLANVASQPFMTGVTTDTFAVLDDNSEYALIGQSLNVLDAFSEQYADELAHAWVGFAYPAYVTPTNPYMLDRNGNSILTGRLTLGRVVVGVANTSGLYVTVDSSSGTRISLDFTGRVLGSPANLVGRQPVVTTELGAAIGKEIRECSYTLAAKSWLPLTITSIDWSGQSFNNARRVS